MKKNNKELSSKKWAFMPVEDKILFIIESFCYLLIVIDLMLVVLFVNKASTIGTMVFLIGAIGLFGCALEARTSREDNLDTLSKDKKASKHLNLI